MSKEFSNLHILIHKLIFLAFPSFCKHLIYPHALAHMCPSNNKVMQRAEQSNSCRYIHNVKTFTVAPTINKFGFLINDALTGRCCGLAALFGPPR